MKRTTIKTLLVGFTLFFSFELFGQTEVQWADSILEEFQSEEFENYQSKIVQGDSLLVIYKKHSLSCKKIETLIRKSHFQSVSGESAAALNSVNEALKAFKNEECKNDELLPEIHLAYARIYFNMNSPSQAKDYIEKGISTWKNTYHKKSVLVELLNNKGNLCQDLDSQVYYLKLAYKLAIDEDDYHRQQRVITDLGYSYAYEGKFGQAKLYFQQALTLAQKRKAYGSISGIFNNLAGVSEEEGEISRYLDSAYYYAKQKGSIDDMQTAKQNAALFHYQNKSYKKGYNNLWESMLLKDSLFNRDKIYAFAEMEQKFQSELKEQRITFLNKENNNKTNQRNGLIIGIFGLLAFAIIVVIQRNKVNKERKRSDELLLNILPSDVAEELKSTGSAEAKQYNHVTVLFTDFVNFTRISDQLGPQELVKEIHRNFTAYDKIIDKNGLEKIKTIGDAYMAVCGLPKEDPNHAAKVVAAALDIKEWMRENSGAFQVRIGVNSGPVVAGIVGVKKYAYDIWGDTVNLAARMEQNSEPGKINVSQNTYKLLHDKYTFTHRGKLSAKGKGEVEMYFVDPIHSEENLS